MKTRIAFVLASLLGSFALAGASGAVTPAVPQKAEVVFVHDGRVMSMKADGTGRRTLARPPKPRSGESVSLGTPTISPDGQHLMYVETTYEDWFNESVRVMVAGRGGEGPRALLDDREAGPPRFFNQIYGPVWSEADGRILVIADHTDPRAGRERRYQQIVSIKPDGSDRRVVLTHETPVRRGTPIKSAEVITGIDVSADGRRVLASMWRLAGERRRLAVIDLATGRSTPLIADAADGRWSPDGARILFASERDRIGSKCPETNCHFERKLYVAAADGTEPRKLPGQASGDLFGANWSADGSRIIFGSSRNSPGEFTDGSEIYTVTPDGGCLTWLTNGAPSSSEPAWAPEIATATSPGDCGQRDRKPLDRIRPSTTRRAAGRPLLWAGPRFGSNNVSYTDASYGSVGYIDCMYFDPRRCGGRFSLNVTDICWDDISSTIAGDGYEGMVRARGGVVVKTPGGRRHPGNSVFLTGGRGVYINSRDLGGGSTRFRDHLELIGALRPAAAVKPVPGRMVSAIFPRSDVRTAKSMLDFERAGGALRVNADRHNMTRRMARDFLEFARDLERLGPVRTKRCSNYIGPVVPARDKIAERDIAGNGFSNRENN